MHDCGYFNTVKGTNISFRAEHFQKGQCDCTTMSFKCNGPTYKSTNCIWPNFYVIWHHISHIYGPRVGMWMVISSQDCIILNIWLTLRQFYFWFMSQVLIKYGQLCLKGEFLRHFKENKCLKVQGYREKWPSLTFQWFTIDLVMLQGVYETHLWEEL